MVNKSSLDANKVKINELIMTYESEQSKQDYLQMKIKKAKIKKKKKQIIITRGIFNIF